MAKLTLLSSKTMKATFYLLLLAISLGCATSTRILDEVDPAAPTPIDTPDDDDVAPVTGPATTLPSGQIPATPASGIPAAGVAPVTGSSTTLPNGPTSVAAPIGTTTPDDVDMAPVATPTTTLPSVGGPASGAATATPVNADVAPVTAPATTSPSGLASGVTTVAAPQDAPLSFFMHDILGGSRPSGRVVTGIVASSDVNSLPFSKPNSQVLPINGGVPLNTINGVINNNNAPLLVGLNGSPTSTVLQNSGNNNVVNGGNNLPFVTAGQLPAGLTLQQLMFGSVTVVDNELTEGHELGSAVLGRAQGFYLASSLDGTSHTIVLTALLRGSDHEVDDTISFFGIHRTGTPVSHIAVVGGTGKYEDAKGYATIEALPQQDQHTTDGVETITQFSVYLTA